MGGTALAAVKMHVVIVVMAFGTMAMAKGIPCRTITAGYGVYNPFFGKYLKGSVNGYPVKVFKSFFNIGMFECPALFFHKKVENLPPAIGNAHVNAAQ